MFARELRSSQTFAIFVVCAAIFTDTTLACLIVPILPYALLERVGLSQDEVQRWNSILLASYGGALMIGSRKTSPRVQPFSILNNPVLPSLSIHSIRATRVDSVLKS